MEFPTVIALLHTPLSRNGVGEWHRLTEWWVYPLMQDHCLFHPFKDVYVKHCYYPNALDSTSLSDNLN